MGEEPRNMKYERSGKPTLPDWWTRIAFPLLKAADYGQVAAKASVYAGRQNPWRGDAISKFVSGTARTRELANGISRALGIPQPFFTARSEKEAIAISAVMEASEASELNPEQRARLEVLDQVADSERRSAIDQTLPIQSADDDERRTGRRRTRRTTRQRS